MDFLRRVRGTPSSAEKKNNNEVKENIPGAIKGVDTEEIEAYESVTTQFVKNLLDSLVEEGQLVAAVNGQLSDKQAKRIINMHKYLRERIMDFGCDREANVYYINPDEIVAAFKSTHYQSLVYQANFAELAFELFQKTQTELTDSPENVFEIIRANFPTAFGLTFDIFAARFIVLLSVQEYIYLILSIKETGKRVKNAEGKFKDLLERYPIEADIDMEVVSKVSDIISESNDRVELIELLKEQFPFDSFIEEVAEWISEAVSVATGKIFRGTALVAAVETIKPGAKRGSRSKPVRKPEAPVVAGRKRRFNEAQPDRKKLQFDSQESDSPIEPVQPKAKRRRQTVRSQPPIPQEAEFMDTPLDNDANTDLGLDETVDDIKEGVNLGDIAQATTLVTATPVTVGVSLQLSSPAPEASSNIEVHLGRGRRKWRPEMEAALLKALQVLGPRWADIESAVTASVEGIPMDNEGSSADFKLLAGRTQAMLKDKARNMKHHMILHGLPVPPELAPVTVSKKVIEKAFTPHKLGAHPIDNNAERLEPAQ
ncbi:hypothetical protein V1512DRAFT_262327 [Lipomyces arxii]|uniref:uncharacterized protein n=1 Tax=Lipomyces arxii TaxID=56418 RepID=UPI0034CE6CCF